MQRARLRRIHHALAAQPEAPAQINIVKVRKVALVKTTDRIERRPAHEQRGARGTAGWSRATIEWPVWLPKADVVSGAKRGESSARVVDDVRAVQVEQLAPDR